jgi:thiol-disulfide isomerase/thioredoxin
MAERAMYEKKVSWLLLCDAGVVAFDVIHCDKSCYQPVAYDKSQSLNRITKMKMLFSLLVMLLTPIANTEALEAPPFTLTGVAGNEVTLPSKKDGVDIYLFWATWCPYCKALMPHLQSMQIEYGKDVRIYALHINDDEDPVKFMKERGYDFILLPNADPVTELYGVRPTPALFIVDSEGAIRFNLYKMIFDGSDEYKTLSNRQKAARRAPYWSAEIRRSIDRVLSK